jgi:hypothetical protein
MIFQPSPRRDGPVALCRARGGERSTRRATRTRARAWSSFLRWRSLLDRKLSDSWAKTWSFWLLSLTGPGSHQYELCTCRGELRCEQSECRCCRHVLLFLCCEATITRSETLERRRGSVCASWKSTSHTLTPEVIFAHVSIRKMCGVVRDMLRTRLDYPEARTSL